MRLMPAPLLEGVSSYNPGETRLISDVIVPGAGPSIVTKVAGLWPKTLKAPFPTAAYRTATAPSRLQISDDDLTMESL